MSTTGRIRVVVALIVAIILVIVIIQNTETVQTRLLFATIEMPRAVLLFLTLLAGYVLGLISAFTFGRSKK